MRITYNQRLLVAIFIPLTHIYKTTNFPVLAKAL